jgi:hypothetical protein
VLATWAQCWYGNHLKNAEFTFGLAALAWFSAMEQKRLSSATRGCNCLDEHGIQLPWVAAKGAAETRLFPVSRATGFLKSRPSWRRADIAMRDMQCQFFWSAWC